jgi:hypothetical protein
MARISNTTQYPIINPSGSDYVVLTDVNDNNATKTATLNSIAGVTGGIQTLKVTLVPSQINNSFDAPVEILTCAAGQFIVVRWAALSLDYNTTPYTSGNDFVVSNGNNVSDSYKQGFWRSSIIEASGDSVNGSAEISGGTGSFPIPSGGNSLYLGTQTANPSGGDSPISFSIGYNIVTL